MSREREVKKAKNRFLTLIEWMVYAVLIGVTVGLIGTAFDRSLEFATEFRKAHHWMIFFMPLVAVAITYMYKAAGVTEILGTNRIIKAAKGDRFGVALRAVPLIFVSTVASHLSGASMGREGAALQLGGATASWIGRHIKLRHMDKSTLVQCGMAAGFTALFGTPMAAAIFALEIVASEIHYTAMLPVLLSSLVSWLVSQALGSKGTHFVVSGAPEANAITLLKVLGLGLLIACLSILFIVLLERCNKFGKEKFKNSYVRALVFACVAIVISLIFSSGDYNGAGVDVIENALAGEAFPWAFAVKMLLTFVCVVAGFKGGLIVPSFFIGATFGCVAGPLLGLPATFAAGLGMVSFFCAVTNCPLAAIVLGYEMFGGSSLILVALCCAITYTMSGKYSLYPAQIFSHAKFGYEEEPDFDDYK